MSRVEFRRDRQFLPAALEVLETPSSPTRRALIFTLSAFVTVSIAWCFIGHIDIEAVAKGKVQPQGRVKVIEPFEPGRVSQVFVEDGAAVRQGDPLVALDPIEARADETSAGQELAVALADAARYRAALASSMRVGDALIDEHPVVTWDDAVPTELRQREEQGLTADLVQLSETLRNYDMQTAEKNATIARLDKGVVADDQLVVTLRERVDMRQTLASHGTGTRDDLLGSLQDLQRAQAAYISDSGQLGEAKAALDTIGSDKSKALSQFVADSTNKLEDAANKAVLARQDLAKAHARSERTTLSAPVDGVVQKLAVTSVGQVVTTGQELMTIVPGGGAMNIEAFIDNTDVGFVKTGQDVAIKLDAFPFTRYGMIRGKVVSIATDAIDEDEARRLQANATSLVNSSSMPGSSSSQDQKFVFPVIISLDRGIFKIGDRAIPITAGMSVTAEIKTDSQRIIDYVLSPLTQTVSEALHER